MATSCCDTNEEANRRAPFLMNSAMANAIVRSIREMQSTSKHTIRGGVGGRNNVR